ncbi:MAG: ribonuclease H-like domain-containing protein [Dehalococcoidia bacterium]
MQLSFDAYLDIETTGLCPFYDEITVIGICLANNSGNTLVQLVGGDVTRANLLRSLRCVDTIYTYNGSRFDLPFINSRLVVSLREHFRHRDLMHDCWRNNLYGGFKAVERQLGIPRRLHYVGGTEAIALWWRYKINNDRKALNLLLQYNKEDVVNLMTLRGKLEGLSKSRCCC